MSIFESAYEIMTEGVARDARKQNVVPLMDELANFFDDGETAFHKKDYKTAMTEFKKAKAVIPKIKKAIATIPDDDKNDMRKTLLARLNRINSKRFGKIRKDKTTFTRNYENEWLKLESEDIDVYIAKCKNRLSD